MRSVLRRLLWLGPALVLITLVTFGALSVALRFDNRQGDAGQDDSAGLPLFFNPEPGAVERLSLRTLRRIAASERAPYAEAELGQLGGAALPFVLPALDSLSPEGRARVVRALRPVGARMGFEIDPSWEPSREVLFWTRFWEEHSIDYRPLVARRAVLRLVQKSTLLRDTEVRQLDTYALDELMRQMASVDDAADVDRVRRLSEIALDMLGRPPAPRGTWRLEPAAGIEDARAVVSTWTDWWSRNRTRYRTYSGTDRITAMLRDTRYGGWVTQAVRHDLGLLDDGRPVGKVLRQGALVSGLLLVSGIFGAFCTLALGGLLAALVQRRSLRWLSALFVLRAALPASVAAVVASWLLGRRAHELALGVAIMALVGAPLASLHPSARLEARASDFIRTLDSLGVARWRVALSTLRLSSAALVLQLGAQLSTLITLTFVVEYALGLSGLGTRTIEALKQPDLNWLMAITLITAVFVGLLQSASELLLALLDPRWKDGIDRLGGVA
jgi:ABC-type dipeptide/oligopeptide/nickel transport system permease component